MPHFPSELSFWPFHSTNRCRSHAPRRGDLPPTTLRRVFELDLSDPKNREHFLGSCAPACRRKDSSKTFRKRKPSFGVWWIANRTRGPSAVPSSEREIFLIASNEAQGRIDSTLALRTTKHRRLQRRFHRFEVGVPQTCCRPAMPPGFRSTSV